MKLEDLQPYLDKIQISGNMPKPSLHMMTMYGCKYEESHKPLFAHAHAKFGIRKRGWICFSDRGLEDTCTHYDNEYCVLTTLAHELGHLKFPNRRHNSGLFRMAAYDFFKVFGYAKDHMPTFEEFLVEML